MEKRSKRAVLAQAISACALLAASGLAQAQAIPAQWANPLSGNWTDPSKWSTNPIYPNNGSPAGSAYDVTIDAPGDPYTITLSSNLIINSLTLNSPTASVIHNNGGLWVLGDFDLKDGTWYMGDASSYSGAEIVWSAIRTTGAGRMVVYSRYVGSFKGVNIGAPLEVQSNAVLNIRNGLTLADSQIDLAGTLRAYGTQTIGGTGQLALRGTIDPDGDVLTLGPNITVRSAGSFATVGNTAGMGRIINQGTISTEGFGGSISIAGGFTNEGTVKVLDGGWVTLPIGPAFTNNGTIQLGEGSLLRLTGTITESTLGRLDRSGGTVNISGTLSNAGSTIALNAFGGGWTLGYSTSPYATINGGHVVPGGGLTELQIVGPAAFTGGVTLDVDARIGLGKALNIADGTTLNGTLRLAGGNTITLPTNGTLGGTGTIVFDSTPDYPTNYINTPASTIDAGITIRTGNGNGVIGQQSSGLVNRGTISADTPGHGIAVEFNGPSFTNNGILQATNGGTLSLKYSVGGTNTWTNNGTIRATNGGNLFLAIGTRGINNGTISVVDSTLDLCGTFTVDSLGPYHRENSTVNVAGRLLNTGSTLSLGAFGGWNLGSGGTIVGGTLGAPGDVGPLHVIGDGTIDGTTINTDLLVQEAASLTLKGAWSNNRTITAQGANLFVGGTPAGMGSFAVTDSTITVNGSFTATRLAAIAPASNHFVVGQESTLDNTGNVLSLDEAASWRMLPFSRIVGGTIRSSGTALQVVGNSQVWGSTHTLDGVSIAAPLTVQSTKLSVQNHASVWEDANITVGTSERPDTTSLSFSGPIAFTGSSQITFRGTGSESVVESSGGGLSIGPNVTIRNQAARGRLGTSSRPLVNQAHIVVEDITTSLSLSGSTVENHGILEARGGAIAVGGTLINRGAILASAGSILLPGNIDNQNSIEARGAAWISLSDFPNPSAATLSGGLWAVYDNATLKFGHRTLITKNAATLLLSGPGSVCDLRFLGANTGSFTITDGRDFAAGKFPPTPFTNSGTLTIGSGSTFSSHTAFTQTTGTLSGSGTFKNTAGTATIAGAQAWEDGASLIVEGGTVNLDSDAGSAGSRKLAVTVNAAGTLALRASQHIKSLSVGGTARLEGTGQVLDLDALDLQSGGRLDLTTNALIVRPAEGTGEQVLAQLLSYVASARGSGDDLWAGAGITSSAAQADPLTTVALRPNRRANGQALYAQFAGQAVDESSLLLRHTWLGDVDLNGQIDATDYFLINRGALTGSAESWDGDLDFSGTIDLADYGLMDRAFLAQGPQAARTPLAASVPEPGALGAVAVLSLLAVRRRCRPRRGGAGLP